MVAVVIARKTYPLRASSQRSTRTPASCAPPHADSLSLGRSARHRTSRASRHPDQSIGKPSVTSCATAPFTLRHPAQKTEHVFMRSFVEDSSHVTGAHRYAEPVSSHKNMFCLLRPPGARYPLALRLINTPRSPRNLAGGWVRPRPAPAVHVLARPRPSVDHAKRVESSPPKDGAAGCCCLRNNPRNPPRFKTRQASRRRSRHVACEPPEEMRYTFRFCRRMGGGAAKTKSGFWEEVGRRNGG